MSVIRTSLLTTEETKRRLREQKI